MDIICKRLQEGAQAAHKWAKENAGWMSVDVLCHGLRVKGDLKVGEEVVSAEEIVLFDEIEDARINLLVHKVDEVGGMLLRAKARREEGSG